mgnify:CR=1 FL=1
MEDYEKSFYEEGFVIDNDVKCNWAVKKIKEATAEAVRLKAIIAAEREELDAKEQAIDDKLENDTKYLKSLLYGYFQTVEHKQSKTQESYKVLDGTLVFKKPALKIVKPEEDTAVLIYCETNAPEYVETKKSVKWGDFKKNLVITDDGLVVDKNTGEQLTFIQAEESEAAFDVRL